MNNISANPIGIFDSGIGGLTVAHAVAKTLSDENLIYFGDTAHLPYGDKSTASIQAYSIKICDMLLKQNCKVILIACNSASAAAYDLVKEYVGSKAKVFNVIEPVVHHVREHYPKKTIGLIGTKQTINSNIYKKKIDELNLDIELRSLATPLLVPMIEEGFNHNQITDCVINEYLQNELLQNIDALILGCTHYPLIKDHIDHYYNQKVDIIDSSEVVAKALKGFLEYHNLFNQAKKESMKFYISDFTKSFADTAKRFFQEEVHLEHYPLWE